MSGDTSDTRRQASDQEDGTRSAPGKSRPRIEPDLDENAYLQSSEGQTGFAPSFPSPLKDHTTQRQPTAVEVLQAGQCLDDFEILSVLGKGGFGVVYLARQRSLDRQVALKVTANVGSEGRTMARLEHPYIVQVFSESLDQSGLRRLLCMQFVPGPTLEAIIRQLRSRHSDVWDGATFLETIDHLIRHPAVLDPSALQDRELLQDADRVEAVCLLGARLAEALAYAHQHGVLHRDIKPGNILVNQYGRPMLVDFNLSFRPLDLADEGESLFGGTLAYMSPEHLDAFYSDQPNSSDAVTEPADIYALGLVLYELATGDLPFTVSPREREPDQFLRQMARKRREAIPALPAESSAALGHTLSRCLHPDPEQRFASGTDLSQALDGCRHHRRAQRWMPSGGRLLGWMTRHPFIWLTLGALVPHGIGSLVNISYNQLRIAGHFSPEQKMAFTQVIVFYNLLAYAFCIAFALTKIGPVYRVWRDQLHAAPADSARVDAARAQSLRFPRIAALIAGVAWFPGCLLFPAFISLRAGFVGWPAVAHFTISVTISGLIALTYSVLFVQCMVVCVLYPRLWSDLRNYSSIAMKQLQPIDRQLWRYQVLAGLIPLGGAMLMVGIGPQQLTTAEYDAFRFLVTGLIAVGMAGFQLATFVTGRLAQVVNLLSGRS